MASNIVGRVTQVLGAVVDVQFDGDLPYIQNALTTQAERPDAGAGSRAGTGRAHRALHRDGRTDGMVRGQEVVDTGAPIKMPVGPETLGRILNVIGEPIDERGPVGAKMTYPIHRDAPDLRGAGDLGRDPRHRHQGGRSARART